MCILFKQQKFHGKWGNRASCSKAKGFTCDQVEFSYDGTKTVLDIHKLDIPLNKTTVLVGENGSGKSTLVKLLLRYFDPNQGTISYNGLPLYKYDIEHYRSNAAAVFQDFCGTK
ncbi:ATP-binding cassette domain-containing protein [Bacillus licheniformis]